LFRACAGVSKAGISALDHQIKSQYSLFDVRRISMRERALCEEDLEE
jgi:hypothetical protein